MMNTIKAFIKKGSLLNKFHKGNVLKNNLSVINIKLSNFSHEKKAKENTINSNKESNTKINKEEKVTNEEENNKNKETNEEQNNEESNQKEENENSNDTQFKTSRKIRFILRKIFRFGMTLGFLLYLYNFYLYKNKEKNDPTKDPLYLDAFYKMILKLKKLKDMIKNVRYLF